MTARPTTEYFTKIITKNINWSRGWKRLGQKCGIEVVFSGIKKDGLVSQLMGVVEGKREAW